MRVTDSHFPTQHVKRSCKGEDERLGWGEKPRKAPGVQRVS